MRRCVTLEISYDNPHFHLNALDENGKSLYKYHSSHKSLPHALEDEFSRIKAYLLQENN